MRRIVLWAASTLTVVVLLMGYRTSLAGPLDTAGAPTPYSAGSTTAGSTAGPAGGHATAARSTGAHVVTGDVVATRYGPVQVQLTVSGDRVTGASVLQYPQADPHSADISGWALPQLVDQTVQQGSVDMVSGATYTSAGYEQSLPSALDRAGL